LSVCYAETTAAAVDTAVTNWPNALLLGELAQELPTPRHFEQVSQLVDADDMPEAPLFADPDSAHIEMIGEAFNADFHHVYVHQIGPNQEPFLTRRLGGPAVAFTKTSILGHYLKTVQDTTGRPTLSPNRSVLPIPSTRVPQL